MPSRRGLLRASLAVAGLAALGACGSQTDDPGGYAFPKQRPSSDDYMSPEERERLRKKAAAEAAERESQQAQQPTPASGG